MAMTLRLTDEETEAFRRTAENEGMSMQELARRVIRENTDRWETRRDAFMTQWAVQNASLLWRLGE